METKLVEVRDLAKAFLRIAPVEDGIFLSHPFLTTPFTLITINGEKNLYDVVHNENNREIWLKEMDSLIDRSPLYHIYMLFRECYRMTFVKYAKESLNEKDFAELLIDAWVGSESPSNDANCSRREIISWFKSCKKEYLMKPEELSHYNALPEKVRIYRGVVYNGIPRGLSWTESKEKAEWFAKRYDRESKMGFLETAVADKKQILCYLDCRGEDELVVDTTKLKITKM